MNKAFAFLLSGENNHNVREIRTSDFDIHITNLPASPSRRVLLSAIRFSC